MWMVPPQYAVWVPGQLSHSNRATPGAQVCFLFIEPGAAPMPDRCCTLKISPLVRADPYSGGARRRVAGRPRHGPAGAGSV